jgi:hypothetical protein
MTLGVVDGATDAACEEDACVELRCAIPAARHVFLTVSVSGDNTARSKTDFRAEERGAGWVRREETLRSSSVSKGDFTLKDVPTVFVSQDSELEENEVAVAFLRRSPVNGAPVVTSIPIPSLGVEYSEHRVAETDCGLLPPTSSSPISS